MKVGDLVIVNVSPIGKKHWPACQGIIVEMCPAHRELGVQLWTWCYVLRGDTGKVEKFHEDWMEAGKNGSW